jgi:DNA-binding transcriptional ArsR family regulator
MSYYTVSFIGVAPLGHLCAGWLAEHIGAALTFVAFGGMSLLAGVLFQLQMATFRNHLRAAYEARGIIASGEK